MADKRRYTLQIILFIILVCLMINYKRVNVQRIQDGVYPTSQYFGGSFNPSISLLSASIPTEKEYGTVTMEYLPLKSDCRHPQPYFTDRANFCWNANPCNGTVCAKRKAGKDDEIVCAPKILIIGAARSGTADLTEWFQTSKTITYEADYQMSSGWCAVLQAESNWKIHMKHQTDLRSKATLTYAIVNKLPTMIYDTQDLGFRMNKTHKVLQVISTEKTRYVLILQDPVRRALSQLYRWKEQNYLRDALNTPLTQKYIHSKMAKHVRKLNECFRKYGPRACIYFTPAQEHNINTLLLWGLYVEYIEEALKFIKKDQLLVVKMEEYSHNEPTIMKQVFHSLLLRIEYEDRVPELLKTHRNKKQPTQVKPLDATIDLLRHFYRPFNKRLLTLLGDNKWCFSAC